MGTTEFRKKKTATIVISRRFELKAIYVQGNEVPCACPPGCARVAYVTWSNPYTGKRDCINLFLGDSSVLITKDKLVITSTRPSPSDEKKYGVQCRIIERFKAYSAEIRSVITGNINAYLASKSAPFKHRTTGSSWIKTVKRIKPARLVLAGNATVIEAGKQKYHEGCYYDLSIEVSSWCPSAITKGGLWAPWNRCVYCYAPANASGFPTIHKVDATQVYERIESIRKQRTASGLNTGILRIGAATDVGHLFFREQLLKIIEGCVYAGLRPVLPSKYLEFDDEVAKLIKRANGVIMPSLGNDLLEPGPLNWARSQEARIEDGILYQEAGCCVASFVLIIPAQPNGGPWFSMVFNEACKRFDRVQLLAIRLNKRCLSEAIFGGWNSIIKGPNARYEVYGRTRRIARLYHPSIKDIVGKNNGKVRLCAKSSVYSHCGGCHIGQGKVLNLGLPKSRRTRPIRLGEAGKTSVVKKKGGVR